MICTDLFFYIDQGLVVVNLLRGGLHGGYGSPQIVVCPYHHGDSHVPEMAGRDSVIFGWYYDNRSLENRKIYIKKRIKGIL